MVCMHNTFIQCESTVFQFIHKTHMQICACAWALYINVTSNEVFSHLYLQTNYIPLYVYHIYYNLVPDFHVRDSFGL